MILEIKGDLFSTPDKLIVHGCNNRGVMGSGVAAVIKKLYPIAFETYKNSIKDLGTVSYSREKNKIIANAITQNGYGFDGKRYVSYAAVKSCMRNIRVYAEDHNIDSISMPRIGAGLGGGDWETILQIIENEFSKTEIKVTIYYL